MNNLINKWDMFVYWLAYKSFKRLVKSSPGFAYLFKLNLDDWLKQNPVELSLKQATETFYDSLSK